jgi:hypothetical protein
LTVANKPQSRSAPPIDAARYKDKRKNTPTEELRAFAREEKQPPPASPT